MTSPTAHPPTVSRPFSPRALALWFAGSAFLAGFQAATLVGEHPIRVGGAIQVVAFLGFTYIFGSRLLALLRVAALGSAASPPPG